jgi:putative oxidoreductase
MEQFLNPPLAHFLIRLVLGIAFVVHGYPKLFKNFAGFSGWLGSMGFRPGKFWASLVIIAEFFGGIALILGFFVQIAAVLIAIDMLVAMWKAKWGKVGFADNGGWEIDLAYFIMAVSLILTGGGIYSIF